VGCGRRKREGLVRRRDSRAKVGENIEKLLLQCVKKESGIQEGREGRGKISLRPVSNNRTEITATKSVDSLGGSE